MEKITIAIDGRSSCGKSTLAKSLARRLGYIYIDSGAMYRGIALAAKRAGFVSKDNINKTAIIESLDKWELHFETTKDSEQASLILNNENVEQEIRSLEVAEVVSEVATIKEVRTHLVSLQRNLGKNGGVVMDGRDIGSVVFPKAELKIFVTADPKVRAQRRYDELKAKGQEVSLSEVHENLQKRDAIDTSRKESPLIQTEDAQVLNNTHLTPKEQLDLAVKMVKKVQNS